MLLSECGDVPQRHHPHIDRSPAVSGGQEARVHAPGRLHRAQLRRSQLRVLGRGGRQEGGAVRVHRVCGLCHRHSQRGERDTDEELT